MKKITAIVWHTTACRLKEQAALLESEVQAKVYSARSLDEGKESFKELCEDIDVSDLIIMNVSSGNLIWDKIIPYVEKKEIKKIYIGSDVAEYVKDEETLNNSAKCNDYYLLNGRVNLLNLLKYTAYLAGDEKIRFDKPVDNPWEGIFHPDDTDKTYHSADDYFKDHPRSDKGIIGLLISRGSKINEDLEIEKEIIKQIEEKGYSALPVFTYSWADESLGAKGQAWAINEYFIGTDGDTIPDALIKLMSFSGKRGEDNDTSRLYEKLDCPVFKPVSLYNKSIKEWMESKNGISHEIGWSIALPEVEGAIEPVYIGGKGENNDEKRYPVISRVEKMVNRVIKWVEIRKKPDREKKCVFVLNNNPCSSAEATVGGGAKLDTLESVARILKSMSEKGYNINNVPQTGREIADTIMERKAVADFRWTTVTEIIKKGGVIYSMPKDEYISIFDRMPEKSKEAVIEAWGTPPGEEKDGVPPAMVHDDSICITGVSYGNAIVCVQPKRGCAGSKCDGVVCKILHDPECPPTHQYIASYKYFEEIFKADFIIHVGTHGTLETLPGKGTGLSDECFPDICAGNLPLLYIYNADNSHEGTVAKRRALATIVDHMQAVFTESGLYEDLEQTDRLVEQYETARLSEPDQAVQLEKDIIEKIGSCGLKDQIKCELNSENIDNVIKETHDILELVRNTQITEGMHVFGEIPIGEKRTDLLYNILRYESPEKPGLRKIICNLYDLDFEKLLKDQSVFVRMYKKSAGAVLEDMDRIGREVIRRFLSGEETDASIDGSGTYIIKNKKAVNDLEDFRGRVQELNTRIDMSTEMRSLLKAADGRFVSPGPGGAITRGRDEVIPTGRNMYTLDPSTVPTKAAWITGQKLANSVIEKFLQEEGRYPETFGMYLMSSDILWAGGEGIAQLLWFMGVKPVWLSYGKVNDFEIIPPDELGRPRIDVSIKISGMVRDNFLDRVELLDRAVRAVAGLDEDPADNFIRKHTFEYLENGMDEEESQTRIFGARPGTHLNGISLQVYASAWKDRSEMLDVFTYFNGYSYGTDGYGKEAYRSLQSVLKNVDITYNKVVSDEFDLLGCCGYFGSHGGMTVAARQLSGRDVRAYYGDSRESENICVRTLSEELDRIVRSKLLNPKWIEGMKQHGYKGAGDICKSIGVLYGWEATTDEVGDWVFDEITMTYIKNKENYDFFKENNPWALEEIERRLIEASKRGLWQPGEGIEELLQDSYLEIEGILEETSGDGEVDFQGGYIDVKGIEELEGMKKHLSRMHQMLG